ncbi:hypothetical protein Pcinc_043326 [Petrolisthes cinctipes]|uniref:Uncharacterized protein n=1 Tax=Petrolisthes cinctipes TaxID=88211 RepID=A0AAE1EGC6_PETCI|nr:hypothetical protein Pcinc_043326 [Petrolisthes cinctipes]
MGVGLREGRQPPVSSVYQVSGQLTPPVLTFPFTSTPFRLHLVSLLHLQSSPSFTSTPFHPHLVSLLHFQSSPSFTTSTQFTFTLSHFYTSSPHHPSPLPHLSPPHLLTSPSFTSTISHFTFLHL